MSALLRRGRDTGLLRLGRLLASPRLLSPLATQPSVAGTLQQHRQDEQSLVLGGRWVEHTRTYLSEVRPDVWEGPSGHRPKQASKPWTAGMGFAARGVSSSGSAQDSSPASFQNPLRQMPESGGSGEDEDAAGGWQSGRVAVCHLRKIPISPRKLTMAARLVRKMHIQDALVNMSVREKKAAKLIKCALTSAYHNAVNDLRMDGEKLVVAECFVGKGRHQKRPAFHGMGKTGMMEKYRSHLTVRLVESDSVAPKTIVMKPLLERKGGRQPGAASTVTSS